MTHLRIHLIYLAIIGFLAYQYWTKAQILDSSAIFNGQIERFLKANNERLLEFTQQSLGSIEINTRSYANPQNLSIEQKAHNIAERTRTLTEWIEQIKISTNENQPLTTQNVLALKDSLKAYQPFLLIEDSNKLKDLEKKYLTKDLIDDSKYWEQLNKMSSSGVIVQLSILQNQIQIEKGILLNYYLNLVGGTNTNCGFGVGIIVEPKKLDLIEGETFEADIYTVDHFQPFTNEVIYFVNNRPLETIDEKCHFVDKNLSVGQKKVKVQVRLRNRLTGNVVSNFKEFEYEVLPKCAKNCQ